MKMIHAMLLHQKNARRYAGCVVAEMIRRGCDGPTMRSHQIPKSVFYLVMGGVVERLKTFEAVVSECLEVYRPDFIYSKRHPE